MKSAAPLSEVSAKLRRRQPAKRQAHPAGGADHTASSASLAVVPYPGEDCRAGRVTGAIQQLHTGAADRWETTIGGGAQPGGPRLGQVSVGAAGGGVAGNDVMMLSDGTAIKSLDVARLIVW